MREVNKIRTALYHTINGIRSGIPLCCVWAFIVEVWIDEKCQLAQQKADKRGYALGTHEYVLCDSCYDRNRVIKLKHNGVIFKWLYPYRNK